MSVNILEDEERILKFYVVLSVVMILYKFIKILWIFNFDF